MIILAFIWMIFTFFDHQNGASEITISTDRIIVSIFLTGAYIINAIRDNR